MPGSPNNEREQVYDFKSPKISTFELADGRSYYSAFTLNKKQFGTIRQCKLMHQLLYSILHQLGIRNSDIVTSLHDPLTRNELDELPQVDGLSSQAWLYMKGKWRLKILEQRRIKAKEEALAVLNNKATHLKNPADQTKIDPQFLHHLWTQIVKFSKPLCSKRDLDFVDQKRKQAEKAKRKRAGSDSGNGSSSSSSSSSASSSSSSSSSSFSSSSSASYPAQKKGAKIGRPKKAHTVSQKNKPRKIYRPKGVTVITAADLNLVNLRNMR